jgi:hypothetical protein
MRFSVPAIFVTALLVLTPAMAAADEDEGKRPWSFQAYLDEAHSWGDITVAVGPDFMTITWDGIILGEQASRDLRGLIDGALSNEKDGEVDATELNDFTFALRMLGQSEFNKIVSHRAVSGVVLIDQAEAHSATVQKVSTQGLEGPVDQEQLATLGFVVDITFPNVDSHKDLHTVRIDLGNHFIRSDHDEEAARLAGDLSLTITGANGWTIDPASIQPACASEQYADNKMTFEGDDVGCFTGRSGLLLTFAITGKGKRDASFLPGFEAVIVLAAAVLLARRRL